MKLLCWDYNGTTVGGRGWNKKDEARPNLKEALSDLKSQGYVSVVTSTVDEAGIEAESKRLGFHDAFDRYFGGIRDVRKDSKEYRKVLEAMKVPVDQASDSVIVIGDNERDHPGDLEKVVFIYNPQGYQTDARVVQALIEKLDAGGKGKLYDGFVSHVAKRIDLEEECGFIYHARIQLPQNNCGVFLSTFNGNPWTTPTVLLISEAEAGQFDPLEAVR